MSTPPPPPSPPTPGAPPPVVLSPAARVRAAYDQRAATDYIFTGPGLNVFLTVITCGIYGYFLFYQLMKRNREHNRRRLELLDAANEYAWEQAQARGLAEELRPAFERVAAALLPLRRLAGEFRDPAIWLVIDLLSGGFHYASGIGQLVGFVLIDQDFHDHDQAEVAVEAELAAIYARLGAALPAPDPGRVKGKQNYVGRIVASFFTCGIYSFWWLHNMQVDGNQHLEQNWPFEDALAAAVWTGA